MILLYLHFDRLKTKFQLPNSFFFRFLKLRHAFDSQFKSVQLQLEHDDLETLLDYADISKPLSQIYRALLPSIQVGLDGLRYLWRAEVQELNSEDWEDMWDYPLQPLVELDQFVPSCKILHSIYYTPQRLHCIYPASSFGCWRCAVYV